MELEFFTSEFCVESPEGGNPRVSGIPLAMQGPKDTSVQNAYDGDTRPGRGGWVVVLMRWGGGE